MTAGSVAPGASVTITATAQAGHEFAGGLTTKTFTHTFGDVPTGCETVSGPTGGGGVAGPTDGGVAGVIVAAPGAGTGSTTAGVVPTVVDAGLSAGPEGSAAALQSQLGRGLIAGGLLLLLAASWSGLRRSGGAHRA